ncbi:hypothetical protein MMC07_004570 [Pseudocyphellaria aurata]|nr:hypothetical protein [Pseudocyphellaria aurata]
MSDVLIVGASRGLGNSLVQKYALGSKGTVYATSRSKQASEPGKNVRFIPGIDLCSESAGSDLASQLAQFGAKLATVIITAGYFNTETFDEPKWEDEIKMQVFRNIMIKPLYTTSAIGPVFIVHHLVKAGLIAKSAKVILVSSESGSIQLRHESEGGGNYAHHASKSALNMVGKLLSLDLKDQGIAVGIVHPGFMRTEMTKGVGFDKFWDDGGGKHELSDRGRLLGSPSMIAVTPDEAAESLIEFISTFDIQKTGEYWAPRGPRDIGTAGPVLGDDLPTPLQLPW